MSIFNRKRQVKTHGQTPSTLPLPLPPVPLTATPSSRSLRPAPTPFVPTAPRFAAKPTKISRRRKSTDINSIQDYEELLVALGNQQVQITLGNDIIVKHNILIDYNVTINLNGHNIVSEQDLPSMRIFDVRHGEFTLTGEGSIFAMGADSMALRVFGAISTGVPDYTVVIIDEHVHLYAPEGTGIYIAPNLGAAYGVVVDLAGSITAHDGIYLGSGVRGRSSYRPAIYLRGSAHITVDEETGTALDAAGIGDWNLSSARLRGYLGIKAETGHFALSHTQISTSSVALLLNGEPDADLTFSLDGGSYKSNTSLTILGKPTGVTKFLARSGDFCSTEGIINQELSRVAVFEDSHFFDDLVEFAGHAAI